MKTIYYIKTVILSLLMGLLIHSCSLDEYNPGGFSMEIMAASSVEAYETFINQCYFSMERYFYGSDGWMSLTEGDTDLWTYQANQSTSYTQWFWFFAGASPNTTYTINWWNGTYDGIGSCNTAISLADLAPYKNEDDRNKALAQARFLRAVYYFNAVEQFGAVTLITEPPKTMDFAPKRTDPLTIYKEIIFPDLEFALQHLPVGTHETTTLPTKKAALGFLSKAYLQACSYGEKEAFAKKALEYANVLIEDAEAGGAMYNAYMYPSFDEVFKESNNWTNKEALWKHRWYVGPDGHGSSNGNYKTNRNNEYFYCKHTNFGARQDDQETRLTWGGNQPGIFMPTQHLLSLFQNADGTLDPRFSQSFQLEWDANIRYGWDISSINRYDKDVSLKYDTLEVGDLAIRFIMPQEADYASVSANKHSLKYLVVDYKDVYNDNDKNINMTYSYTNVVDKYTNDGTAENLFRYFYPSLTKHNSSNYYVANASKKRNGNLNATFMMRMAEVYLIAAEAELYTGGANALKYINKVRDRAGADLLSGTVSIRTILDERARELCGEYCRFYDLKRVGMFKDKAYLEETHPDLAVFFRPEYALRPIPRGYLDVIEGSGEYYQNPGY